MSQRIHRVTPARSLQFESRNSKPGLVLCSQSQHPIAMKTRGYSSGQFMRRLLRQNEPKLIDFKEPRNLSCYLEMAQMNRVKSATIQSNPLSAVHWCPLVTCRRGTRLARGFLQLRAQLNQFMQPVSR